MIFLIRKYKNLFAICIIHISITYSCVYDYFIYKKNIVYQGNYLSTQDTATINNGITKKQVIFILGSSIIQDNFCYNTWYYISSCELNNKYINQITLILTFNNIDILIRIEKIFSTIIK